jgi:hypothetical protein
MAPPRRYSYLALFGTALAGAVLAPLALAPAGASTATTASVLSAAKTALAKETSVHLEIDAKSGSNTNRVVADLAEKSGSETISANGADIKMVITSTWGYVSGNATGLTSILGLTSAQAKKVGSHWITMKAGTTPFVNLSQDATMAAMTSVLPSAKGMTLSRENHSGTSLFVLRWTTAATSSAPKLTNTFSFRATGATLPVSTSASASNASETTTFTKWGEQVMLHAPAASDTVGYTAVTG